MELFMKYQFSTFLFYSNLKIVIIFIKCILYIVYTPHGSIIPTSAVNGQLEFSLIQDVL